MNKTLLSILLAVAGYILKGIDKEGKTRKAWNDLLKSVDENVGASVTLRDEDKSQADDLRERHAKDHGKEF